MKGFQARVHIEVGATMALVSETEVVWKICTTGMSGDFA